MAERVDWGGALVVRPVEAFVVQMSREEIILGLNCGLYAAVTATHCLHAVTPPPKHFILLTHFTGSATFWGRRCCQHRFTDEETEAQEVKCLDAGHMAGKAEWNLTRAAPQGLRPRS